MSKLGIRLKRLKKLNFGSGADKREGYLNVDIDPGAEPDLLITNNDYSMIPKNHYNEILANDILEHIKRTEAFSVLLEWAAYLRPGGMLLMQTTSVIDIAASMNKGDTFSNHQLWLHMLFGTQAREGDYHTNSFTKTTLKVFLTAAGFKIEKLELRDKWLFCVEAKKVSDWEEDLHKLSRVSIHDNEGFIEAVYQEILGRDADSVGMKQNIDALQEGVSRIDVLKSLFTSPEHLNYVAKQHEL